MSKPTHIDLCSGFGGFALAAQWAGFETIGFAEIADYPSRIFAQHFPGIPNWGDIRNTPAFKCNLLTCGDPCQPYSVAGGMRGETDDRYLWPAVLDAIGRHEPDWMLLENVTAIRKVFLPRRLDDLANRGYQCQAFDIPSCAVGLPSVERHIWIVAAHRSVRLEGGAKACFSWKSEQGEVQRKRWTIPAAATYERARWHLSRSSNVRSRKGLSSYVERIKGLGNAVPPPVAYEFLRIIRALIPT